MRHRMLKEEKNSCYLYDYIQHTGHFASTEFIEKFWRHFKHRKFKVNQTWQSLYGDCQEFAEDANNNVIILSYKYVYKPNSSSMLLDVDKVHGNDFYKIKK